MRSVASDWNAISGNPLDGAAETAPLIWRDSDGPLTIHRARAGGERHYRLRLGNDIAVDLLPSRTLCTSVRPGIGDDTLDHFLADQVIPRALAGEGQQVIHAGAVRHEGRAILLLGASGRGKSTLTTSFHLAGLEMLGDDATVIGWTDDRPVARAVYPSLRLLPDSIRALLADRFATSRVADYSPKRRVSMPIAATGKSAAIEVAGIVVLDPPATDIIIRRLSVAEACIALVSNSFALDPAGPHGAQARLGQASKLARLVPSFAIAYPRDYARLPAVRAAILEQLA